MFEFIHSMQIDAEAGKAQAHALVPGDSVAFADHFPSNPLLPGSILIELAAQTAGPLAEELVSRRFGVERWALLGMVRNAKFLRVTSLPATIHVTAVADRAEASRVISTVNASVQGLDVLRAELWMMMCEEEPDWTEAIRIRRARVAQWKANS